MKELLRLTNEMRGGKLPLQLGVDDPCDWSVKTEREVSEYTNKR